jgi:hypothetical protein
MLAVGPSQAPIQYKRGSFFSGVMLLDREADHSPPSSYEVKSAWSYTCTVVYAFQV